jgi:hypothetical protein
MAAYIVGKGARKHQSYRQFTQVRAEKAYMSVSEQGQSAKHKQFSVKKQLEMKQGLEQDKRRKSRAPAGTFGGRD